MLFPHELLKRAGMNMADVAGLVGVSQVTGWRWMHRPDAGVNTFLRSKVNRLAGAVRKSLEAGALPDPQIAALPPRKRLALYKKILRQHRAAK